MKPDGTYIVTVDNGTSSTKTVLCTAAGVPVAEAERAYSLHRLDPLWAEIDANIWWEALCSTVREVLTRPDKKRSGWAAGSGRRRGWYRLDVAACGRTM